MSESAANFGALFRGDSDWLNNACVGQYHDATTAVIHGYRHGADLLVIHIMENGRDQDYLVYPIAFLYRHHLELIFKHIIKQASVLLDKTKPDLNHHELRKLWSNAKSLSIEVWNEAPEPEEFPLIDDVVEQFAKIDPNSTAFRYSRDLKGRNPLKEIPVINVRHLGQQIKKCSDLLEGITLGLSEYLQNKWETQAQGW